MLLLSGLKNSFSKIPMTNKRIAKNTLYLYFRMGIIMLVQLYTSRIVLATLGIEDFGIYNVVGGVILLFNFIKNPMTVSTQRFLTFALGKGIFENTRKTFSISFSIHLATAVLILLLGETIGLWFLNTQLNIPAERMEAANFVYQFTIFTACVSILQVPFRAAIISHERMKFFAYLSIAEALLKLCIVYLLLIFSADKLELYAMLIFAVSIVIFLCYKFYSNKHFKETHYKPYYDKAMLKEQLSFSGWSFFGAVANVTAKQGVNMLLNIFYGVVVNAAMGIANQVNNAVNHFVTNFQTAFKPQIVKLYAKNNKEQLLDLIINSAKFSYILIFAMACPLILNMDFALKIWLNVYPDYAIDFCRLMLIHSLIESLEYPLWISVGATGRIKIYQITVSCFILLNIIFSFILLKLEFSPVFVLYVKIAVDVVLLFVRMFFVKFLIGLSLRRFTLVLLKLLLISLISLPLPVLVCTQWEGFARLLLSSASFLVVYAPAVFFIGLNKNERKFTTSIFSATK